MKIFVCINKNMNNRQTYRTGLVDTVNQYAPYLDYAVTLTMKQHTKIKVRRFSNWDKEHNEFWVKLNEEIALDTLKYFNKRLTHYTHGKDALRHSTKNHAQPLVIATLEGMNTGKHLHWHLAVGNLNTTHLYEANELIAKAWQDCDFANKQMKISRLTNTYGWLDYMAKETSVGNTDAICINSINQPESIKQLVGNRKLL
jgi:hypothetical protein